MATEIQRPTELEHWGGEFQLGRFAVNYGEFWDLEVRCDTTINGVTVAVTFAIAHDSDRDCWKRGGTGSTATYNGELLWDPAVPGKVRTAYKKELPTAAVMQAISAAAQEFLQLINPPENWLGDLFYTRRLQALRGAADSGREGYQHLMENAARRVQILDLVLQKPPAEKIALFRKYGEILCRTEISTLFRPSDTGLQAELLRELGLEIPLMTPSQGP